MLKISIPGYRDLQLKYLVLDYNGTLACEGKLIPEVRPALEDVARQLEIHVLTADTFGTASAQVLGLPCKVMVLPRDHQDEGKLEYVRQLGPEFTVCIGNGRNDLLMLKAAALGICVIQEEGASADSVLAADVVSSSIVSALRLLLHPLRLAATLRS